MEREQSLKFMHDLLRALVARRGSDLFITAGFPPAMKIDGKMTPVSQQALTAQHTSMLCRAVMNDKQAAEFERTRECNFAISPGSVGRFRVNAFLRQVPRPSHHARRSSLIAQRTEGSAARAAE